MNRQHFLSQSVLSFRRWSRSKAAAFQTVGRVVRIAVLPVVYTLHAFAAQAQDQVDSSTYMRLVEIDSVRVEQVRLKSLFASQGAAVQILTGDELELPAVSTLEELLAQVPGLDVRQRGAHGVQGDIAIRGGGFDQVLILLNGVNLTDAQSGHHNLNLPIEPSAIARIEVLSGPSARLYGPGAFAGAINIITKTPSENHIQLSAKAGQYGLREAFAASSYSSQDVALYGFASGATSEGYRPNTDFLKFNAFMSGSMPIGDGRLRFQAGHQAKDFGAQAFYSARFPEEYESTRGSFISTGYSRRQHGFSLESEVAYRSFKDHFQLFRYSPKAQNFHHTQLLEGRVLLGYTSGISSTKLALNHRYDNVLSRNLGDKIGGVHPIQGSDLQYDHYFGRNTSSLSLEEQLRYRSISLALGGMVAYSDHFGWNSSYGADISYSWESGRSLYGAYNSSFRYPTFTDLFYTDPAHKGNRNLKVENAQTAELGLRYAMHMLYLSVSGFYRWGRDIIDWVADQKNHKMFTSLNHYRCNTYGGEITAGVYPRLNGLESVLLSYSYAKCNPLNYDGDKASYAYNNLLHHATLTVKSPLWRVITLTGMLDYSRRNGRYVDHESKDIKNYPGALIFNLRAEHTWRWLTVFADANNLFGTPLYDFGAIQLPGRWISVGVRCNINY